MHADVFNPIIYNKEGNLNMTPEELQALITRLGDEKTREEAIVEANDKISKMILENEDIKKKSLEDATTIAGLRSQLIEAQQTGLKLAMSGAYAPAPQEPPHEETIEEFNKRMAEIAMVDYPF